VSMDAAEYYRDRDHRTNACVDGVAYVGRRVSVTIDEEAAASYSGQVAFVLSVNLTARWCRRVRVQSPRVAADSRLVHLVEVPDHYLANVALAIAQAVDPFGDFAIGGAEGRDWIRLHVGAGSAPQEAYRIRGHGWQALAGNVVDGSKEPRGGEPLGAALASCIGVAWAFRAALGDSALPGSVQLSLWNLRGGDAATHGPPVEAPELGEVLLIGCGAVGSSMAYLFPLVDIRGRVQPIDGDMVDATNLNRSPMFVFSDVARSKCDVVASYLARAGIAAEPTRAWFDEAVSRGLAFHARPDVVIPAANDRDVRRLIQHQVPPLQVYGTTSRDWQAFLGRHIPLVEDCLACRFPSLAPAEPPLACGTGSIVTPTGAGASQDAALPFLSTAAGVLAVAELLKTATLAFPVNPNFACLDFRGPLSDFLLLQRGASVRCICEGQGQIWNRLNGETRFA
jgi:molybdopterin/thiamine biosynthesis adenylyltransferase